MLERFGIDPLTIKCFSNTWRKSTKKTYKSHLLRWGLWAKQNDVSILNPKIQEVLKFLRVYFETGVGYGAINAARCALSLLLPRHNGRSIGESTLITWFVKSCYSVRPPQPKYAEFWPVEKVLTWLNNLGENISLNLKLLSLKLAVLLLLVSAQRGQTILSLHIDRMITVEDGVIFKMKTV